jgi:recombination protein RecR
VDKLPGPLRDVVERLRALPGIGPKSALRIGLTILEMPRERAEALGTGILHLRERLCLCSECASLAEMDPCPICADPARDSGRLCLVPDWDSLLALEEMGLYRGRYLVLGGLLSPLDGMEPAGLRFDLLRRRLAEGDVAEVILALGATVDAESTASYVQTLVEREFPDVDLSRLAQGIPIGGEVKYMDKETLKQSLAHRQALNTAAGRHKTE